VRELEEAGKEGPLAPKGRNETGIWWRRHDEYDSKGDSK
jgi:hypothetical protein